MAGVPIVVHRLSGTGGRRVVVRGEIVGLAHSDHDLDVFLERVGLPDADLSGLLDDPRWVEWRGDPPHEWDSGNAAGS
ncbi:hypothetical protein [Streptomyces sp. NBC_01497]|uniref:hypothetical protein n=1 Tax=Streptomyces sp. NBC_01497 TaxID=2903885 RepID=UPI002E3276CB|nr:hypothetical protein [Streptomyces sp. NBC_01497]